MAGRKSKRLPGERLGPSILDYGKPGETDNMMLLGDVLGRLKFSAATLYRRIKEGKVPPPCDRHLGKNAWRKDEIEKCAREIFSKFQ